MCVCVCVCVCICVAPPCGGLLYFANETTSTVYRRGSGDLFGMVMK